MNPLVLACIEGAVGFAIGAGTNDLAIRWIFHTVFAKKKRAIAEAVQRVISNELMTPEKVAQRLTEPSAQSALKSSFADYIDEFCARDLPAFDQLPEISAALPLAINMGCSAMRRGTYEL